MTSKKLIVQTLTRFLPFLNVELISTLEEILVENSMIYSMFKNTENIFTLS